jgi:hypothetical protein
MGERISRTKNAGRRRLFKNLSNDENQEQNVEIKEKQKDFGSTADISKSLISLF